MTDVPACGRKFAGGEDGAVVLGAEELDEGACIANGRSAEWNNSTSSSGGER
jgi:hypothetical protein